jgi:glycosyltransferase involved in cell wall biosynthesis
VQISGSVRIALVYDCLYPATVGGAERWLRAVAEVLADEHQVTYVTRRQWRHGVRPIAGVKCVAVAPGWPIYSRDGRRRALPPLLFGIGTFLHFLFRRNRYDIVHCLSYPFFSLLAVRVALAGSRTRVICEWLECLTHEYWRTHGGLAGRAGPPLQRLCLRLTPEALVFSDHTARRMREEGFGGPLHKLGGLAPPAAPGDSWQPGGSGPPLVVYAGRHVPDKRVMVLPEAIAVARREVADITAILVGDGPQREAVLRRIDELDLGDTVSAPGFIDEEEVETLFRRAACVVAPSLRDGYGMAVAEAAARGAPVVVCPSPDNAAVDRVVEGVNGTVAASPAPEDIGEAIVRVVEAGPPLRESVTRWFAAHSDEFVMTYTIERLCSLYSAERARAGAASSRGT